MTAGAHLADCRGGSWRRIPPRFWTRLQAAAGHTAVQGMSHQPFSQIAEIPVASPNAINRRRKELPRDFERAPAETKLPERPDHEAANRFLVKARREMANRE